VGLLTACSGQGGGSLAGMGASETAGTAGRTPSPSTSPSGGPTAVATASADETRAFFTRAAAAERHVKYVETQVNATVEGVGGGRVFSSVVTIDRSRSTPRVKIETDINAVHVEALVERNGDVYAKGLISNMADTWVRIRPQGTDGLSKGFADVGRMLRGSLEDKSPVSAADALVFERGVVRTGATQLYDEEVDVYRAEIDLAATLKKGSIPLAARSLLRRMIAKGGHPKAFLELRVDDRGLIREMVEDLGPLHYEFSTRPVRAGHTFDRPPASAIADPDRIVLQHATPRPGTGSGDGAGGTTRG
jgi:hypothetical protein